MTTQNTFEAVISTFPSTVQTELRNVFLKGGVIPSKIVASCLDQLGIDLEAFMIRLLPVAATYAQPPISDFHVGAVALGMPPADSSETGPGSLYLGANMEFSGEALSFSVHGEQSATNNAWLNGESGLQSIAINASPCGYCRQFLNELNTAKELRIILKSNNDPKDTSYTTQALSYFLPEAFGPEDLGLKGGLMETAAHGLTISENDKTARAALASANASYAPYTNNYSSVALKDANGRIFSGRYAENAAYNPSMSPLQSALAFMRMNLPPQTEPKITEAVLVEAKSAISQKAVTSTVLSSIAPSLKLKHLRATAA